MYNYFYHASNLIGIKRLLPLSTLHNSEDKVCYLTPFRAYALFYIRDMTINHVTCGVSDNGIAIYHEQFPDQLRKMYQNRSGYLYTCENNDNIIKAHTNGVWAAYKPITVTSEEYIEEAYAEILKSESRGEVQVIRYESISDEKKREITIMMSNYISKNRLLFSNSPKACFFHENFPEAWEMAKTLS